MIIDPHVQGSLQNNVSGYTLFQTRILKGFRKSKITVIQILMITVKRRPGSIIQKHVPYQMGHYVY